MGDIAPYQAFAIGGLGSMRGYGEGAVGSGRSCLVANSELTLPLVPTYFIVSLENFSQLHSYSHLLYINFLPQLICILKKKLHESIFCLFTFRTFGRSILFNYIILME